MRAILRNRGSAARPDGRCLILIIPKVAAAARGRVLMRAVRSTLLFACIALLSGCAEILREARTAEQQAAIDRASARLRHGREAAMNQRWQNQRYSELVAELGSPARVMSIPGGGNPPGFVAVFEKDRATGCIDAFALMYAADPIVRVYHCR